MKVCLPAGTRTSLTTFEPPSTSIHQAIIVVVVSALLSILAFAFIAVRIIRDATFNHTSRHPKILFFRTQLGHYAGCLILSNVFISVAGLIDIYWLIHSGLTPGLTCSTQAVLMQIGVWGTCWFTVTYGVHTLISLVFCVRQVYWHSAVIITIGWAIAFVAALVPLMKGNVYGPAGISCSITNSSATEAILLGALPIVLSTFLTTAVYTLSFIVWHRKKSASNRRKIRAFSSAYRCGENKPAEYHKLINMVIWTTFWFPLAFVLLMLPFCIIRILVHAGQQVSLTLNVFADACASILGFVNVGLLFNTIQVISHVSRAAKIAAETMTFGHDASRESPTGPHFHSQSEVSSYESSERKYNSTQASHSHSSSCSSVDSNTGLMCAEKTSNASTQTKAAPLSMHIIPPAELGRQLDNEPGITSPDTHNKRNGLRLETVTSASPMVNISLSPPPVGGETGVIRHKSRMQDERYFFEPMADTEKGAEGLGFRPKVPLKMDPSSLPIRPPPISYSVTDKRAAPAAKKFGVPAASSDIASQIPAAFLGPEDADLPIHRVSTTSSFASTGTLCTDSDSDCSGELMHAYKARLGSQVPQLGDDEVVFRGSLLPNSQRRSAWARRITMDSIWSQESEDMTEDESQEAYWQLVAELLGDLGVTMGDQADAPATGLRRQSTFGPRDARPQPLRVQPRTRAMSKCSVHFADTLRPKCAPNQSVV